MKWNIVADSSCDLYPEEFAEQDMCFSSVPFTIYAGDTAFTDAPSLNTRMLLEAMEHHKRDSGTACPSPAQWIEEFERAECTIALTISSQLSGSFASAVAARDMVLEQYPEKNIAILDSHSAGPELALCVKQIIQWVKRGIGFEKVVVNAERFLKDTHIIFALCSFENLIKSGRMNRVAGIAANLLSIWGIGIGSDEGTIQVHGKARGEKRMLTMLVEYMQESGFRGGSVAITHCHNLRLAEMLKEHIQKLWSKAGIQILSARGLCSYYAERGGLILSYGTEMTASMQ